jgi:hypothetical protein
MDILYYDLSCTKDFFQQSRNKDDFNNQDFGPLVLMRG